MAVAKWPSHQIYVDRAGTRQQVRVQARGGRGTPSTEDVDAAADQYLDKANDYWNTVQASINKFCMMLVGKDILAFAC